MSRITKIADAVVDELNEHEFSLPFTALRHYQPVYDLQEMKSLHVTVVPRAADTAVLDRTNCKDTVQIDIAVQKKLTSVTLEEIDPYMDLVQEISDFFKQRRLKNLPVVIWIGTSNKPIYSPEHLQQLHQFTSVLTLSFRSN